MTDNVMGGLGNAAVRFVGGQGRHVRHLFSYRTENRHIQAEVSDVHSPPIHFQPASDVIRGLGDLRPQAQQVGGSVLIAQPDGWRLLLLDTRVSQVSSANLAPERAPDVTADTS